MRGSVCQFKFLSKLGFVVGRQLQRKSGIIISMRCIVDKTSSEKRTATINIFRGNNGPKTFPNL